MATKKLNCFEDYQEALLPCPCCGCTTINITRQIVNLGDYIVKAWCDKCGIGTDYEDTMDRMLKTWNNRVGNTDKTVYMQGYDDAMTEIFDFLNEERRKAQK